MDVTVNQTVSGTVTKGQMIEYDIAIPTAAKYTVETGGTASILWGIWEGAVQPSDGDLRICGVGKRGCRELKADAHIIRVTGNTAGTFTFLIRAWSFWDYFTINFYKSSC